MFSETDYAFRAARKTLKVEADQALAWMMRTARWKYIFYQGFPPQLFDLEADPDEQHDLGRSADHADIRAELHERLFNWQRQRRSRRTISDEAVAQLTDTSKSRGYLIGQW